MSQTSNETAPTPEVEPTPEIKIEDAAVPETPEPAKPVSVEKGANGITIETY